MIKCTFKSPMDQTYWALCQSITFDPIDGWTMDGVQRSSSCDEPHTGAGLPPYWQFEKAEAVDKDAGTREVSK